MTHEVAVVVTRAWMRMRKVGLKGLAAAGVAGCLFGIPVVAGAQGGDLQAQQAAQGVAGRVSFLKGSLQRGLSANGPFEDLRRGSDVREGDFLQTPAASRAELLLADGSVLRLGPNTQLRVGNAAGPLARGPAEVHLTAGSLWARIQKAVSGEQRFSVHTPSAVAGVRGTDFQVATTSSGATFVAVHEGSVRVNNGPVLERMAGGGGATWDQVVTGPMGVRVDPSGSVTGPMPLDALLDLMIREAGLEPDWVAFNQERNAAPPEDPSAPADGQQPAQQGEQGSGQGGEQGADLKVRDDVNKMSPPQMVGRSDVMLTEMRAALRSALDLISSARKERDIVRLNCLNERVTQIKGVLKVAEDAHLALQEQAATGGNDDARVSFTKVALARDRVATLRVQAQNCVGAESYYGGDTEVVTTVNPSLAGGDPFFGDRLPGQPPPQSEFSDNRPGVDNSNPDTPPPPPPTSSFQ